jgi:glycosyltransferase involved in cell wall biosynthesis
MNTVSIITAVDPTAAEWLPETYASVAAQELPDGWNLDWHVQSDSLDSADVAAVRALVPDQPWIQFGASRRGGPGIARTMALARTTGSLIKVLDADDILTPGALSRDIAALNNRWVGWTTSRVLDMTGDAFTPHSDYDPSEGRLKSGSAYAYWLQHEFGILVHPATLCVRRWLLLAVGGWMALPASEDTSLLLALDAVSDGWFTEEPGLHYRRWPRQMSASAAHYDPDERAARRQLITDRVEAIGMLIDGS